MVGRPAVAHFDEAVGMAAFPVAEMAELKDDKVVAETRTASDSDSEILALAPRSVPSVLAWWSASC